MSKFYKNMIFFKGGPWTPNKGEGKTPTPKRGFPLPFNPSLFRHGLGLCPKNPDLYFDICF